MTVWGICQLRAVWADAAVVGLCPVGGRQHHESHTRSIYVRWRMKTVTAVAFPSTALLQRLKWSIRRWRFKKMEPGEAATPLLQMIHWIHGDSFWSNFSFASITTDMYGACTYSPQSLPNSVLEQRTKSSSLQCRLWVPLFGNQLCNYNRHRLIYFWILHFLKKELTLVG